MKLINCIQNEIILLSYNEISKEIYNTFTMPTDAKMQFNDLDVAIKSMQEGTSKDKVIAVFLTDESKEAFIIENNLIENEETI